MNNKILERYKELLELGVKVTESAYISAGEVFSGFKYVDKTLYNTWRIQTKSYIKKYLGESSLYFQEFDKVDNSTGLAAGTNKDKFEKQLTILTSLKFEIEELPKKNDILEENNKVLKSNKVFIVHGHEELAISQVSEVIRKLGLEPIVLRDQASQSSTVIEKIEKYTDDIGFGVILYTECDMGGKCEKTLKPRARQNVVLEHGYLMAKLGRKNTIAFVKGEVETPSDIKGVVYTPMDKHNAWKYQLTDELKESGYKVSKDNL